MRRIMAMLVVSGIVLAGATAAWARPHRTDVIVKDFFTVVPPGIPDGVVVAQPPAGRSWEVRRVTITVTQGGVNDPIDNWVIALDAPGPFDVENPANPTVGVIESDPDPYTDDLSVTRHYDLAIHLDSADYLVIYTDAIATGDVVIHVRLRVVES